LSAVASASKISGALKAPNSADAWLFCASAKNVPMKL
jgi:hypothetical protein